MTSPIEPLATSPWGWSEVVSLVTNQTDATAIIRLLSVMRNTIAEPLSWWQAAGSSLADETPTDLQLMAAPEFDPNDRGEALMRVLKPIALNPGARADALLSLDVHIAYLRAQFDVGASERQS